MSWVRHSDRYGEGLPILAFVDGVDTTMSITAVRDRIKLNERKKWSLPAGLFFARIGNLWHPLPRTELTQAITGTTGKLKNYQLFKVGDILTIVEPYLMLGVTALAVNATVAITVAGNTHVFTFLGTLGSTVQNAATEMAAFINASGILSSMIRAVASGSNVHLFSSDGVTCHTITLVGGTITRSPANGIMTAQTPVGTISSFDEVDPSLITLTASATNPVPVGGKVGVYVDQIGGLHPFGTDWTVDPEKTLALVTGAKGVWEQNLPYIDGGIKRATPNITYGTRF